MSNVSLALLSLAVLAGLVGLGLWMSRRQGAREARTTALSQAQAQTIKNERERREIDDAVNVDADLLARARRVMQHNPRK